MNLLQSRKTSDFYKYINPISFRKYEYFQILNYIEYGVNFVSSLRNNYLTIIDKKIEDKINYTGMYNSKFSKISVTVKNNITNEEDEFLSLFVPTLIEDNYFYLNGNYYVPGLYLIDYPITVKKNSLIISTLFNSITYYFEQGLVIITRQNIPLTAFLQLFIDEENENEVKLYNDFCAFNKLDQEIYTIDDLTHLFSIKFNTDPDLKTIIEKLELIILDDYTKNIYRQCYPDLPEINLKQIILKSFELSLSGPVSFIDFSFKRVTFLEFILKPYINKITSLSIDTSKGGIKSRLNINELNIIKYFLTSAKLSNGANSGLSGNFLYDTTNLYPLLLSRISLITPNMTRPPSEVSNIHPSSFGKACTTTISNQDPGEIISLVPDTTLDACGLFSTEKQIINI